MSLDGNGQWWSRSPSGEGRSVAALPLPVHQPHNCVFIAVGDAVANIASAVGLIIRHSEVALCMCSVQSILVIGTSLVHGKRVYNVAILRTG